MRMRSEREVIKSLTTDAYGNVYGKGNALGFPYTNGAREMHMTQGSSRFDRGQRSYDAREPLEGVVFVSVGNTHNDAPLVGALHTRVARLQDLAWLIHACVPEK